MSPLLNTRQLAEIMGVTPRTIKSWVQDRRVPYVKIGRSIRFRPEEMEKHLERRTIKQRAI